MECAGTGILRSLYWSILASVGSQVWEPFAVDFYGRLWTSADRIPLWSGRYGRLRTSMDDLRPSTDQKVGDSSSSGRAADQGFCTDVKCPNRTIVKCRDAPPREIQALHDFPASTPPRTHGRCFGGIEPPDLLPYRVSNPAPAARTGISGSAYVLRCQGVIAALLSTWIEEDDEATYSGRMLRTR
jgi:hypothetical protein